MLGKGNEANSFPSFCKFKFEKKRLINFLLYTDCINPNWETKKFYNPTRKFERKAIPKKKESIFVRCWGLLVVWVLGGVGFLRFGWCDDHQ